MQGQKGWRRKSRENKKRENYKLYNTKNESFYFNKNKYVCTHE